MRTDIDLGKELQRLSRTYLEQFEEEFGPSFDRSDPRHALIKDESFEEFRQREIERTRKEIEENYDNPNSILYYHNDWLKKHYADDCSTFESLYELLEQYRERHKNKKVVPKEMTEEEKKKSEEYYLSISNGRARTPLEMHEYIKEGYERIQKEQEKIYGKNFNQMTLEEIMEKNPLRYVEIPKEFRYRNNPHKIFLEGVINGEVFTKAQRKDPRIKKLQMKARYLSKMLYCYFISPDYKPYGDIISWAD